MTGQRFWLTGVMILFFSILLTQAGLYCFDQKKAEWEEKIETANKILMNLESENPLNMESSDRSIRQQVLKLYLQQNKTHPLYPLGQQVKTLLQAKGLSIVRYQEIHRGQKQALEFHLEGQPLQLLQFLSSPELDPVQLDSLILDSQHTPPWITLEVSSPGLPLGFESQWIRSLENMLEQNPHQPLPQSPIERMISPRQLAGLFPNAPPAAPGKAPLTKPIETRPEKGSLRFIGRVADSLSGELWYFKQENQNSLIKLSPHGEVNPEGWKLLDFNANSCRLSHENTLYEVER